MDKIFSNDFVESEAQREKEKKKFDHQYYTLYLAEKTPWFVGCVIQCLVDLPNINFLATGSYDQIIRLWDLRSASNQAAVKLDDDDKTTTQGENRSLLLSQNGKAVSSKGGRRADGSSNGGGGPATRSKTTRTNKKTYEIDEDFVIDPSKMIK